MRSSCKIQKTPHAAHRKRVVTVKSIKPLLSETHIMNNGLKQCWWCGSQMSLAESNPAHESTDALLEPLSDGISILAVQTTGNYDSASNSLLYGRSKFRVLRFCTTV